ncbi:MAG TPA: hypothetical protein GX702_09385 [Chloroflexi bacterium]|jgi:cytochrome c biogenesis protein CcdA/thiol-disulfide isomerase/thioredoxin|nr:hypothetical protein [Chloroflexota bacterium]
MLTITARILRAKWPAVLVAIMLALLVLPIGRVNAEGAVHVLYFYSPDCPACRQTQSDTLAPLEEEFGERLIIDRRNVQEPEQYELFMAMEERYDISAGTIPTLYIGEDVMVGTHEIGDTLRERIEHYLARGGVDLPDLPVDVSSAEPTPSQAEEPKGPIVYALMFWSQSCGYCHQVMQETLPPLLEQYENQFAVVLVETSSQEGYQLWQRAMDDADMPADRRGVPMMFIGDEVLVGGREIPERLPGLIESYLAEGGVGLPPFPEIAGIDAEEQPTPAPIEGPDEAAPIHLAYFYQSGCGECDRVQLDLNYLSSRYPQIVVHRYDIKEQAALAEWLGHRAGIPEHHLMTAPAVFIGDEGLAQDDLTSRSLEEMIRRYEQEGADIVWEEWEADRAAVEESIVQRFLSFGFLTILGAGLLDGVNPCAFATMIFLVSYLALRKRKGKEILITGAAFTLGVFLTYLGVGFGFLRFLTALPALHIISRYLYGAFAILCLLLAWGSFMDYRKARQGRLEDMSLKLPDRLRNWSKALIREGSGARNFVLASFVLGFGVSIIEMACTGQVYLPTIIFVLGNPQWRANASLALLAYNIMFILPLVVVFSMVYYGTTSQQLVNWMTRHTAGVKLGTALLFVLLAGWLGHSVITF